MQLPTTLLTTILLLNTLGLGVVALPAADVTSTLALENRAPRIVKACVNSGYKQCRSITITGCTKTFWDALNPNALPEDISDKISSFWTPSGRSCKWWESDKCDGRVVTQDTVENLADFGDGKMNDVIKSISC